MTTARDAILARIASAWAGPRHSSVPSSTGGARTDGGSRPEVDVPRDYRRVGEHAPGTPYLLELLTDRLVDYKATVYPSTEADLITTIGSTLEGTGRLLVPPGLPDSWAPSGTVDEAFTPSELDGFDTVLTTCAAAAAETGTIVLDGSPGQGRRAVSLVPDRHICVVRADQVVQTVPELLTRLDPLRPLTFISGPSATSDIELQRVEGVHGPRTLIIILVVTP